MSRSGDRHLRGVLAFGGLSVGRSHLNALLSLCFGAADLTVAFLLSDSHLGFIDGSCRRLAPEGVDVARRVRDVLNVDVQQFEPELAEFNFESLGDVRYEFVAVGVDFFDWHRGDDHTHLTEDHISGLGLDISLGELEEAFGGVLHDAGFLRDGNGERCRGVHPDVLLRQCPLEFDIDRYRSEVKPCIPLHDRQNQRAAALIELGGLAAGATENHEDSIGGTFLISAGDEDDDPEQGCESEYNGAENC